MCNKSYSKVHCAVFFNRANSNKNEKVNGVSLSVCVCVSWMYEQLFDKLWVELMSDTETK